MWFPSAILSLSLSKRNNASAFKLVPRPSPKHNHMRACQVRPSSNPDKVSQLTVDVQRIYGVMHNGPGNLPSNTSSSSHHANAMRHDVTAPSGICSRIWLRRSMQYSLPPIGHMGLTTVNNQTTTTAQTLNVLERVTRWKKVTFPRVSRVAISH